MTYPFMVHIKVSQDPQNQDAFMRIKEQINYLNRHDKIVNWLVIEQESQRLFTEYGFDLQTAVYYTFAKTQRLGLVGFTEGCELLSHLIIGYWSNIWPTQLSGRISILNWLNARMSPILHQYSYTFNDLRLLYRIERALSLIQAKLDETLEGKSINLQNSLYFIQEQCKQIEQHKCLSALEIDEVPEPHVFPSVKHIESEVEKIEENQSCHVEIGVKPLENSVSDQPELPKADVLVSVSQCQIETDQFNIKTKEPSIVSNKERSSLHWRWFIFGGLFASIVFGLYFLYYKNNMATQIEVLHQRVKQYKSSQQAIKNDLVSFNKQLLNAEATRKGITISSLKTMAYEIDRKLVIFNED